VVGHEQGSAQQDAVSSRYGSANEEYSTGSANEVGVTLNYFGGLGRRLVLEKKKKNKNRGPLSLAYEADS